MEVFSPSVSHLHSAVPSTKLRCYICVARKTALPWACGALVRISVQSTEGGLVRGMCLTRGGRRDFAKTALPKFRLAMCVGIERAKRKEKFTTGETSKERVTAGEEEESEGRRAVGCRDRGQQRGNGHPSLGAYGAVLSLRKLNPELHQGMCLGCRSSPGPVSPGPHRSGCKSAPAR